MADTPLAALDPREQKQVEAARKAVEKGNPGYAMDVCTGLLKRHPGCLEVRRVLRLAQQRKAGARAGGLTKLFLSVSSVPFVMAGAGQVKKDPAKALETAEKLLAGNPATPAGHKLLAQAAEALGFPETAVFAWECLRDLDPEDTATLLALGRSYLAVGRQADAVRMADVVLKRDPGHGEALALAKDAAVALSMERGRWDEEGDYRAKLKSEEQSVEREQAARVATDEASLRQLIERGRKRFEEESDQVNLARELSGYHRQLGELEEALHWVRVARGLPQGAADATLERVEVELQTGAIRQRLAAAERDLAAGLEGAAERRDALAAELQAFRLNQAAALVEKYPNDLVYRFEFGELLLGEGRFDEAAQQFQMAVRNPKVRLQALVALAKVFKAGRKYDLAADQLETAKQELPTMDERKKEVLYELADCREQMGDRDKALAEYKAIYAADLGYRDVASKINAHYEAR